MEINLNNRTMNVVETAGNGVVNNETLFKFIQKDNVVTAKYAGGGVNRGFLIGKVDHQQFSFKYAQVHADGNVYGGSSNCEIVVEPNGSLQLIEHFDWEQGKGKNVFREIDESHL